MDHRDALQRSAVERYLLAELAAAERDEFEEHFFDCAECASDLKTTAAFLDGARAELGRGGFAVVPPQVVAPVQRAQSVRPARFAFLWRPAFAAPAFAVLVAILGYQNLVQIPHDSGELEALRRPEVLTSISLIGANARGGAHALGSVTAGDSLLLSVDVPTSDRYTGYSADLEDPSGATIVSVPVSAAQARDTVAIRVPGRRWAPGDYTLVVLGHPRTAAPGDSAAGAAVAGAPVAGAPVAGAPAAGASTAAGAGGAAGAPTELARYRFSLNAQTAP